MLSGCLLSYAHGGGGEPAFFRSAVDRLDLHLLIDFFDDDEDLHVFVQTQEVFDRVATQLVLNEHATALWQGNALGLMLHMVIHNWTYYSLLEIAEAAYIRVFEDGMIQEAALHLLLDSIQEAYSDGSSSADRLMRWILAALCERGTPIRYSGVNWRAYRLLVKTGVVPPAFISVFEAPEANPIERMAYEMRLRQHIAGIRWHINELETAVHTTASAQLDALIAIFDWATEDPVIETNIALIESVTTGYDRLFRGPNLFYKEALLGFIEQLALVETTDLQKQKLVHCIWVMLCDANTNIPYASVRRKAYEMLEARNALPLAFVPANLG